jgi:hypothetical protein
LNAAIVSEFSLRVLPIAPRSKITTRRQVQVAADVSSKLVDKLNDLHRLHDSKGKCAITTTHGKFRRAAKRRAHGNAAGAHQSLLKMLLLELALVHCGFHAMLI